MQIQYYGLTCFRISARPGGRSTDEIVIYIDPLEGELGIRNVYGHADVVFLTTQNSKTSLANLKGDPKIFSLPGEYSYRGINIMAFEGLDEDGEIRGNHVAYLIDLEDIRIAHLGMCRGVSKEALSYLADVDIVMIPIGGNGAMNAVVATEFLRSLEPKIIVPMYYKIPSTKLTLDEKEIFYKELGAKDMEVMTKWTGRAKDVSQRNMDVIELETHR